MAPVQCRAAVLGLLLVCIVLASGDTTPPGSRGRLWNAGPRTDRNLKVNRSTAGWLMPSSSPFLHDLGWLWEHPYAAPLTTRVSTVRLLGGWRPDMMTDAGCVGPEPADCDVAYRCSNASAAGKPGLPTATPSFCYRWQFLFDRLDAFVQNGLVPTVVLDNVPYGFVANSTVGTYGQTMGPDWDLMDAYGTFIGLAVDQMIARYTGEIVAGFRWRVGTEANNPKGHWSDTLDKYVATYKTVQTAVLKRLPSAAIGPSNFCPCNRTQPVPYSGFADAVIDRLAAEKLLVDFVSISYYGGGGHYDPSTAFTSGSWLKSKARILHSSPTLEVQEYGCLNNEAGVNSNEPGSFGAAWIVHTSARFVDMGVTTLFHWDWYSTIEPGVFIANSNLLLMVIGERFRNARVMPFFPRNDCPVPPLSPKPAAAAGRPRVTAAISRDGSHCGAVSAGGVGLAGFYLDRDSDRNMAVLLAVFHPERKYNTEVNASVSFQCPIGWACDPSNLTATHLRLDETTTPIDVMLSDLQKMNGTRRSDGLPYSFPSIANPAGEAYVRANKERYRDLQQAALLETPYTHDFVCSGNLCTLSFPSPPHAVWFIHLAPKTGQQ